MDPQVMKNVSYVTDSMMKTSVTEFQMFVGLEPTGKHSFSFSVNWPSWLTKTCWYQLRSIWILCRTLAIISQVSWGMQGAVASVSLCMLTGKVNTILYMYKSRRWQPWELCCSQLCSIHLGEKEIILTVAPLSAYSYSVSLESLYLSRII
jgi:hypothetical protein